MVTMATMAEPLQVSGLLVCSPQIYNPHMVTPVSRITITPEKRSGKPCVRNTRITVRDVLGWLASGMTFEEVLFDLEQRTREDILACLMYAAERKQHAARIPVAA